MRRRKMIICPHCNYMDLPDNTVVCPKCQQRIIVMRCKDCNKHNNACSDKNFLHLFVMSFLTIGAAFGFSSEQLSVTVLAS